MARVYWILIAVLVSLACTTNKKKESVNQTKKWSVRMANSIIARSDRLLYYDEVISPEKKHKIKWQYDVAMVGMVIDKLGDVDSVYSQYMEDYVNYFVNEDGTVKKYKQEEYNIDRINPARNIITLYKRTGEEKYRKAIELFVEQMKNHPTTSEGGFWHKKVYPYQIWLDGIYMGSPFLAQYAQEFNKPEWFDVVATQINLAYTHTLDPKTGLLYHAWDESREQRWANPETGKAPNFWSRAIGWYVMAIVDVLDYMPEDHPQRGAIINKLQNVCDALLKVRDPETGMWYQVLDQGKRQGNYLEGSGSAMYVYAFAKGARMGYLDKKYKKIAEDAFDGLVRVFIEDDKDGILTMKNICGGCGLGGNPYRDGSFEYYITETKVENDTKGVAPFILAALELGK